MEDNKNNLQDSKRNIVENKKSENGLDKWNNRLEENLEPEDHNDVQADENAKEFSSKFKNEDGDD